jgi:hypothetical protein
VPQGLISEHYKQFNGILTMASDEQLEAMVSAISQEIKRRIVIRRMLKDAPELMKVKI